MKISLKKESRIVFLLLILSFILLVFTGCSEEKAAEEEKPQEESALELTLEELKEFNGQDGKDAYIAVDGIIYDITDSPLWKNGEHNNFSAGNDLTEEIKNVSPHGVANLERVPEVGRIVENK